MKRYSGLFLIVLLGVAACVTERGEIGKPFNVAGRKKLLLDQTTRAEARLFIGEPLSVSTEANGLETWRYEHSRIEAFSLPVVTGIRATQTPHALLTLRFEYGILTECSYYQETYQNRRMEITATGHFTEVCAR